MKRIFVISDTHFGHRNIIKYCNRPFQTVEDMDVSMIERWNSTVNPKDIVFFLGDFLLNRRYNPDALLQGLNGRKILIRGNHDDERILHSPHWEGVFNKFVLKDLGLFMCHYPIKKEGFLTLHGHSHGSRGKMNEWRVDMSVECWNYTPVLLDEVIEEHKKGALRAPKH